jgi:polysaccharide biosynthesis protein PelF
MAKSTDICLVIEGSYPYVTGGVSSWIQWLMKSLREFSFSVVSLIAEEKSPADRRYPFPENMVSYEEHVIFDYEAILQAKPLRLSRKKWRILAQRLHVLMREWKEGHLSKDSLDLLHEIVSEHAPGIFKNFLEDEEAFALLTRIYEDTRGDAGFVKYFYNFHNIHLILFRLLTIVPQLPQASIYHSPGTGYGGLLACLRSVLFGGRSILTEHGIYLQEREMELLKSEWLDTPYLKDMWIDMFSAICQWQYNYGGAIVTLYKGNKDLQMEYGAKAENVRVVPNGIDIERFRSARQTRCAHPVKRVGLVGRVDSVKDVKTYIQAISIIQKGYPAVEGLIIGPTDDQPEYYRECRQLVDMLDLKQTLTFTGRADVLDYYKTMDLLLLTSIKEAMPLVVMEAMACGIPVVATSVGSCRELLYGMDDDIGQAGIVARIMDAEGIADAAVRILRDPDLANRFAQNGIRRIEQFYREELIIEQYQNIYREAANGRTHLST